MMKSVVLAMFIGFIISCLVAGYGGNKGDQYCELFWGNGTIYTVMGNYTNCTKYPGFYDLTGDDLRAVHGEEEASTVEWNGIREWMVDSWERQEGAVPIDERTVYTYGNMYPDGSGFEMVKVADIDFSAFTGTDDDDTTTRFRRLISFTDPFYQDTYSKRDSTAIYKANQTVYELVSANCSSIYVMQSFYIGRPGEFSGLTDERQLQNIGKVLDLPSGWTYRSRVLETDLFIYGVNGTTTVMQDDLRNSYSAMDEPFDESLCYIESLASIK